MDTIKVEVTRSDHNEAIHKVHAVVCNDTGDIIASWGNPGLKTYFRSSAKPFQLLTALVNRPHLVDECSDQEIAVMSSSHSGEPGHIETVRGILKRYGLDEGLFRCGQHYPYYEKAIWEYGHNNVPISTINNNCTGKHTAMLLAVQERGWDFNSYLNGDHPLQIENTRRMARMSGQKFDQMNWGVDGCSVPTWWQSVKECAVAYARFSSVKYPQDEEREPIQRIFDGFHKAGWHTAGTGRFGVDFNNESGGNWLGKIGGEGIFGVGIRNRGIGITVKVEDGNSRAIPPALLYVMKKCDLIDAEKLESLKKWDSVERPNAAERLIGYIRVME